VANKVKDVEDGSCRSKQTEQAKKLPYQEMVEEVSNNIQPSEYNSYCHNTDDKIVEKAEGLRPTMLQSQGLQVTRYTSTEAEQHLSMPLIHEGVLRASRSLSTAIIPRTPDIEESHFSALVKDPNYD
jgi:hypothetical protein